MVSQALLREASDDDEGEGQGLPSPFRLFPGDTVETGYA
jgi:hypothetical protein